MIKTANIAGAGIGGLSAAIALAQRGIDVRVFEQAAQLGEVGAGLQLSPNAMKVIRTLELEQAVWDVAFAPKAATIRNGRTGGLFVSVPLGTTATGTFGAPYLHVHRADLHDILLKQAESLGVQIETGQRVEGYDVGGFWGLNPADLCIDASGVKSNVAAQMNPSQPPQFTGQIAWRGLVPAADLPTGLVPPDATVWTGKGKHIVTYYLRGGALVNFVAVEERDSWVDADWKTEGDISVLRQSFGGWHSTIKKLLSAAQSANIWALHDKAELATWSDGPVTLLGDACHPTLPFLAQGAAMAIEDSFVLAQCLEKTDDVDQALKRYEGLRKPRTSMLQNKARQNADMFHLTGPFGGAISHMKLNVARALPTRMAMLPFNSIYAYDAVKQTA